MSTPDPSKRSTFTCGWCGKSFEEWTYRNPKFCSRQCNREHAARQPKPAARRPENHITLQCEVCKKTYSVHNGQTIGRASRFCSNECKYQWVSLARRGKGNVNYRGGTIRTRGRNWEKQKRAALKRDGYKCQICGKKLGKRGWDYGVHHVTPYRLFNGDFETANALPNLITLCRKCHGAVEAGNLSCPRPLF